PHRPSGRSDAMSARDNCLQCHDREQCRELDRVPSPVRDDCIGCHMPRRVKMNVIFRTGNDAYVPPVRRIEHRIAVDRTARDEVLLAWYRGQSDDSSHERVQELRDSLAAHWLSEADSFRRQYRFRAAIGALREALSVSDDAALRDRLRESVE